MRSYSNLHKAPRQDYNAVFLPILQDARLSIMMVPGGYDISITRVSCRYQPKSARY